MLIPTVFVLAVRLSTSRPQLPALCAVQSWVPWTIIVLVSPKGDRAAIGGDVPPCKHWCTSCARDLERMGRQGITFATNLQAGNSGSQVFGVYKLGGEFGKTWVPHEGRLTPQTYQFSELTFNAGLSYYTTMYPSFGGLVSVVKGGQTGTYALTPAFNTRKAHSVGFLGGQLFDLIAQKTKGLTSSTFPIDQFGNLSNLWVNLTTLEADAATVFDPTLVPAGDRLVAAYVLAGNAYVRASKTPQSAAQASDFPVVGQVNDAVHASIAWDGSKLYLATISSTGALTVQRLAFTDGASWETVTTHVTGAVTDASLAGKSDSVLVGVRQGGALRVYLTPSDDWPSFDAQVPGNLSLINSASGAVLAVLNLDTAATHTPRTFQH
ncbi:MAG: hypothetical protein WDO69_05405 [Pseudomonadota bacterium]